MHLVTIQAVLEVQLMQVKPVKGRSPMIRSQCSFEDAVGLPKITLIE